MMGSPFYYDVLFDDGPGDVVFHDCMWSGICTCCIQLLHQDSYYQYANESPDLKVEDLNCRTQQANTATAIDSALDPRLIRLTVPHGDGNTNGDQTSSPMSLGAHNMNNTQTSIDNNNHHHHNHHQNNHNHHHHHHHLHNNTTSISINNKLALSSQSSLSTSISPDLNSSSSLAATASSIARLSCPTGANSSLSLSSATSPETNPSSSSSRTSPDTNSSSASSSSSSASNSTSPKPVRRREHNDSERKRRDHLRNAFNFLRDQVPRFKAINKKPPRIQILHEATKFVQGVMKESQELEKRLEEERAKHERLKNL